MVDRREKINRAADESVGPFGHVGRVTSFMREKRMTVKYGRLFSAYLSPPLLSSLFGFFSKKSKRG